MSANADELEIPIHIATMAYIVNQNAISFWTNLINDEVIAYSKAIESFGSLQFDNLGRERFIG